jgi:hypothetical protein
MNSQTLKAKRDHEKKRKNCECKEGTVKRRLFDEPEEKETVTLGNDEKIPKEEFDDAVKYMARIINAVARKDIKLEEGMTRKKWIFIVTQGCSMSPYLFTVFWTRGNFCIFFLFSLCVIRCCVCSVCCGRCE